MQPVMRATWSSQVGAFRARKNKEVGTAARARLLRIRDKWGNDVRVDTSTYKRSVLNAEPTMTSETAGYIIPNDYQEYFWFNEYGTHKMSARPSMRQAMAAESSDFASEIERIIYGG